MSNLLARKELKYLNPSIELQSTSDLYKEANHDRSISKTLFSSHLTRNTGDAKASAEYGSDDRGFHPRHTLHEHFKTI